VKVNGGDVVGAGSPIATLAPVEGSSDVVALLYVPAGQGKRIRPRMRAEISPSTVECAEYGYIRGGVVAHEEKNITALIDEQLDKVQGGQGISTR
jgi:HlyD family secretion protein